MRLRRKSLFVECLEDRTVPAGLVDAFASTMTVVDTPAERLNVVGSGGVENPALFNALSASPYTASVHHVGFGIYNVTLNSGIEPSVAESSFSTLPGVIAAEPDYIIQVNQTPNDTFYSQLYGMTQISAPTAWDSSTGSGDFVVAVIDTGVDYNHPDLAANMWHNPNETPGDGIDNDGNGIADDYYGANFIGANTGNPFDDHGHGTHVSGTIGGIGNNALGVAGVNWHVKIMALKFLNSSGSGSTSDAVEALNYAVAHGVKVSNNSWGGGGYSTAMFNAIKAAQNQGHIFVVAAGNDGQNIDSTPSYPASYNLANVVAVAATTSANVRASYSNYGANTVDIAAPGSGIISTTPNNTYSSFSGTSMATPHVAGAIALYWDSHPSATASEVIAKLTSSADTVTALNGLVTGGRRLNVGRMMESPPPSPPPPPPSDTTGAHVTSAAFSGASNVNLTSARFTFSEAIDPSSFTVDDIASFTGPGGSITPDSVTVVSGSDNTVFDVAFPAQTAGGTYTMTIGPAILDAAGNAMDQNENGTNGESSADQYIANRNFSPTSTKTFTATGLPLAIRDFTYTRATLSVDEDFTISDLNVKFSITHSYDSDLVIKLFSPGGQVSTLVNRRGGSANNFSATTMDDESATPIRSGAAPFSGTYRPETSMTTFDGRNARGTWTLEVYDSARLDTGSLTAFSIIVTGTEGATFVKALGVQVGESFTDPSVTPMVPPVSQPAPSATLASLWLDDPDAGAPASVAAAFAPIALPPESTTSLPVPAAPPSVAVAAYLPPPGDSVEVWDNPLLM